jgi:succinate-semialdehyde dehydrogenase/glutarate-semialdehyde dehydrogenase
MKGLQNANLFREACYINGQWLPANEGGSFTVDNPSNGSIVGKVPLYGQVETHQAIDYAYQAWLSWKKLAAKARADLLLKWSQLIEDNKDDLAYIMTLEQGKPLTEAETEISYANAFIRWFAEEGRRVYGEIIPSNHQDEHIFVTKQSIGVVAAITPWNFPMAMITRKLAPALAVGCTVVLKPAEATPFTALALAALAEMAGIPPGVINIITGDPQAIGKEMTSNPLVRKLSFTGSTAVGRILIQQSAPTIKKLSLELGGNAPFIVFEDADIDAAVEGAIKAKFRNSGQTCVCANRFYIQNSIYAEFSKKLQAAMLVLKVGDGLDPKVQQGPLINKAALTKVKVHIKDALDKGATLLCGGQSHALGGLFFEPTLLVDANASMLIAQEETFGPVAALFRFETDEEVIQLANATEYGLASYLYSNTLQRVWKVADALEYGMVGVNVGMVSTEVAPFGGIKQSGIGREGSHYGLDDYLEIKYLCMK